MSSTFEYQIAEADPAESGPLRWRSWPLAEHPRWSWLVVVGVLAVAAAVAYLGGSWWAGLVGFVCLSASLWHFFLPVTYQADARGIRRHALGRTRLVPWQAVQAYRARATGIVLFQRPDPSAVDAFRSLFIPYGPDEDETLCAVRHYVPHAEELPNT